MKEFVYAIKDPQGMHARPAGKIVAVAKNYTCHTNMWKSNESYDLKKLLTVMGAKVAQGDEIVIRCEGSDEVEASAALEKAFEENL